MSWYASITLERRKKLFGWMRATEAAAMRELRASRALEPAVGEIAVGAGAFDRFIQGEAPAEYLRALRRGKSPDEALAQAKAFARESVAKHNEKRARDVNWQRHAETADAKLEHLHRTLLEAIGE
jgi:hypothetical protein